MDAIAHRETFREALLTWFEDEKEDYPWRRTRDPWAVLVSEVMLQQTQVATVINKGFYTKFLQKFPTVEAISEASEQEILKAWEGLGYYRRVRNLQKTARAIVAEYGGKFPATHEEIIDLPGVGPYTAGAVGSFAFGLPVELVDANVARLFSRLFDYHEFVDGGNGIKQLWQWARELLDSERSAAYNSSLMELGQKICKNKKPQCMICPVRPYCKTNNPESLPKKKPKRKTVEVLEQCAWVQRDGKILLQQQGESGRRAGMWILPIIKFCGSRKPVYQDHYKITHHKVDLRVYDAVEVDKTHSGVWVEISQLGEMPMPSPFRKAVKTIMGSQ